MSRFQGIYPALITPFDSGGQVDTAAIGRVVDWNIAKGVSGFYVGGSTGEAFLLSAQERMRALEAVVEAVAGRAQVIANIGMFSTGQGVELARHAESLGVDAISSVPPIYYPYSREEYRRYYADLLEAVAVPLLIYNVPALSGVRFSQEDFAAFFEEERILGVKYTAHDLFLLERLICRYPDKTMFIGHDEIFLSALAAGVEAAIGSTMGFMAEKFLEIRRLFQSGKLAEARRVQGTVNQIVEALVKVGVFKGVKYAFAYVGFPCGECRRPFLPLSLQERQQLDDVLRLL